jgi:hypothetical protein
MASYLRIFLVIGLLGALFLCQRCSAQEMEMPHAHRPQDLALHNQFYKNWMMPDNRSVSCCHAQDCEPAESKFENGHWLARKVSESDKDFTPVPDGKIEHDRDSPDGRSHICGRHYGFNEGGLTVFCFIPGSGG